MLAVSHVASVLVPVLSVPVWSVVISAYQPRPIFCCYIACSVVSVYAVLAVILQPDAAPTFVSSFVVPCPARRPLPRVIVFTVAQKFNTTAILTKKKREKKNPARQDY